MKLAPPVVLLYIWMAWVVSWVLAAFWREKTVRRAGVGPEFLYRLVIIVGFILMFGARRMGILGTQQLWPVSRQLAWSMVGLVLAGVLFTWWARIHLGRLWSATITRKEGHHVIDTGPYAFVRHPIYTGLILATLATAVMFARPTIVIGAICVIVGIYVKARLEEKFLREQLGAAEYDAYARRVPMLIPFPHGK